MQQQEQPPLQQQPPQSQHLPQAQPPSQPPQQQQQSPPSQAHIPHPQAVAPQNSMTGVEMPENKRDRHLRLMNERLSKIEHDFSDQKHSLYRSKLEALKREMRDIQNGTHPEFTRRVRMLADEKESLVVKAQCWRDYQNQLIDSLYKTEIELAEQDYATEKDGLKDRILQQIDERRRKIREERESLSIDNEESTGNTTSRSNARKLRRRNQVEMYDSRGRRGRAPAPVLAPMLKESEIMEDFMILSKYMTGSKKMSSKRRGK